MLQKVTRSVTQSSASLLLGEAGGSLWVGGRRGAILVCALALLWA